MKYINVKRIFLNIGLMLLAVMLVYLCRQLYDNSFLVKTTGAVIAVSESEYSGCYIDNDGNEYPMLEYDVSYVTDEGESYTDNIIGEVGEYSVGETVEVVYDKRDPYFITYIYFNWFLVIVLGVPGGLLVFFCRSAFKGYKSEYLDRYKNAVWFSVISGIIPIAYWIYYEFIFVPGDEMFAGLGEYLLCISLFIIVPMINIIVWICAAALYCRRCKKKK